MTQFNIRHLGRSHSQKQLNKDEILVVHSSVYKRTTVKKSIYVHISQQKQNIVIIQHSKDIEKINGCFTFLDIFKNIKV